MSIVSRLRAVPQVDPHIEAACAESIPAMLPEDNMVPTTKRDHGGRPLKYTPALALKIAELMVATDWCFKEACHSAGVTRYCGYKWEKRYPYFEELMGIVREYRGQHSARYKRFFPRPNRQKDGQTDAQKKMAVYGYKPEFVDAVRGTIRQTARALGVPKSTVMDWTKRYPDFGKAQGTASFKNRIEKALATSDLRLARLEARLVRFVDRTEEREAMKSALKKMFKDVK